MKTLFLMAAVSAAGGPQKPDEFPVQVEFEVRSPASDGSQSVAVTLTIDRGYYLFANPPGVEELTRLQTTLTVNGMKKLELVKVTYPQGKFMPDEAFGGFRVYKEKVTLEAVFKRAAGDTEPASVTVRFKPYDDRGCRWSTRSFTKEVR